MIQCNILICGAGIIGLTLARELASRGHEDILVLEKEESLGRHASGRNSGVLHAGIYYAPGSERARTCLEGNRLMQAYCMEKGLPLLKTGKVIVTSSPTERGALHELYYRAVRNGTPVQLIDEEMLGEIEPNARTFGEAIFSPETAVVDPGKILESIRHDLESTGRVRLMSGTRLRGRSTSNRLKTSSGPVSFRRFVNAAGAHSDRIARFFGLAQDYTLLPFKGLYRKLKPDRAHLVRGNIYPVPDVRNPFLGVHFTRSVEGTVYLGPTAIPALGRENYGILSGLGFEVFPIVTREVRLFIANSRFRALALEEPRKYLFSHFFRDAAKLVKELNREDILPASKVGIRPQLVDVVKNELVMDFLVLQGEESLHVLNAISPAFTSSMAFAKALADRLEAMN